MSFKVHFSEQKAIATFKGELKELEITNAFIEIVEKGDIKQLDYLIFDYTNIESYTIPIDYLKKLKILTRFSNSWNNKITAISVTTNSNLIKMLTSIIKHSVELDWTYLLFDNLSDALKSCEDQTDTPI